MSRTQVVVTRRGQTTIPAKLRKKLGITEGTLLEVTSKNDEIVFRKAKTLFDLAGTGKLTYKEAIRLLDELRSKE